MRLPGLLLAFPLVFVTTAAIQGQAMPEFPAPEKEHTWLKQFVGQWEATCQARMGPDQPVTQCKGRMSSRMLGEFWVVSELEHHMGDLTVTGIQTIGYDPDKKTYVGTWVDSTTSHMWKYEGTVDPSGKTLTLEAEGPNCAAPGTIAKFRDAYEFKSKDQILATSSMQGDDGKWVVFMTGDMRRMK